MDFADIDFATDINDVKLGNKIKFTNVIIPITIKTSTNENPLTRMSPPDLNSIKRKFLCQIIF